MTAQASGGGGIIDFHTHAFPDSLAERAMPQLEKEGNIRAVLDGKISSLLASMDRSGIEISVVASIATKPEQFEPILRWSKGIASDRLIPFPSIHPRDPRAAERVRIVHAEGLKGIKLHPYYQDCDVDDGMIFPVYEALEELGLILLCHTGFDFAFARVRRADPRRVLDVLERFPRLKFVTTHMGAWEDWDEVRAHILGKPIYVETSFSIGFLGRERSREMIFSHPEDRLIFGTDSPWEGQEKSLEEVRSLGLGPEREKRILSGNARSLLGLPC